MRTNRVSFRCLLPIVSLATWLILVPSYVGLQYYRVRHLSQGSEQAIDIIDDIAIRVPKDRWLAALVTSLPLNRYHYVTALNLPGLIPDVLLSLPTTAPGKWHPSACTLEAWRSFTLPFYCLPFWWLAGLGLDALLRKRRLHRLALWFASVLFLLLVVILFGYFTSPPLDQADLRWLLPGFGLWAVLFGVVSLNWLRRATSLPPDSSRPNPQFTET